MAGGVAAGANSPDQSATSRSGTPASAMVGTSGYSAARRAEVMASTLIVPALTCPATGSASASATKTSPPSTAVSISPLLL